MTDVLETATDWFARKRSGRMTPDELRALESWLDAASAHRDAFESVEWMWAGVGVEPVRSHPRVLALRERGLKGRWRRAAFASMAAAACIAAAAGVMLMRPQAPAGLLEPSIRQEFRTGVGEKATVKLPDGSTVTLDTDTVLRTRETAERRTVVLERGQAFFRVAKDASRPFTVTAGGRTVTALGTAFSVKVQERAFEVVLVEGQVRVDSPVRATPLALPTGRVQSTQMEAGSELVAVDNRHWSVREVNGAKETAWLHGRLVYESRPLSDVVADMNRYSERKIVLADPALGSKALSGTYRAGDVDGFVRALEDYGVAQVASESPGRIELAAAQ